MFGIAAAHLIKWGTKNGSIWSISHHFMKGLNKYKLYLSSLWRFIITSSSPVRWRVGEATWIVLFFAHGMKNLVNQVEIAFARSLVSCEEMMKLVPTGFHGEFHRISPTDIENYWDFELILGISKLPPRFRFLTSRVFRAPGATSRRYLHWLSMVWQPLGGHQCGATCCNGKPLDIIGHFSDKEYG